MNDVIAMAIVSIALIFWAESHGEHKICNEANEKHIILETCK